MNTDIKYLTVLILTVTVFVSSSFAELSQPAAMAALEKMPAVNAGLEQILMSNLMNAGREAIKQVCDLVVSPGTGDDTKARYVLSSLSFYKHPSKAVPMRKMYSSVLVHALRNAADDEVKSFFIAQLQQAGTIEVIADLDDYLGNDRLCEQAAMAILTISPEHAGDSFMTALQTASQGNLPTIINALGRIQCKEANSVISAYASSKDKTLRMVSLRALADIGDSSSIKILEKALKAKDSYERTVAASCYVRLAERLNENGGSKYAVGICRDILKSKNTAINSSDRSAALSVLVEVLGEKSNGYLLDAFDDGDDHLQYAAVNLAGGIKGSNVTKAWTRKLENASPQQQIRIIRMLGSRGDKSAVDVLRQVYGSGSPDVNIAALRAIVKLEGPGALKYLMKALNSDSDAQVEAVKSMLLQMPLKQVALIAVKELPDYSSKAQVALIEILAERRTKEALEVIFSLTASNNSSVNIAATKALGKLAGTEDIDRVLYLMLNAKSSGQKSEASRAAAQLCLQSEDVQAVGKKLLAVIENASADQQALILKLLPHVGTGQALEVLVSKAKSSDKVLRDSAVRSLAKWKDAGALDAMLDVADSTDQLNHHVITLKSYVSATSQSDLHALIKLNNFKKAMSIARRDENKKFIISRLSQVRSAAALKYAVELLDVKLLADDAAAAVEKIALPSQKGDKGLESHEVLNLLVKAQPKIKDNRIQRRVAEYIQKMPESAAPVKQKKSPITGSCLVHLDAPEGFYPLFNGVNLVGWKGVLERPYDNPKKRAALSDAELAERQARADELMRKHWKVVNRELHFDGKGFSIATDRDYGDFEMLVDWKLMTDNGDSGIYLRGSPQVQIWDPAYWKTGSGGLYNNKKNPSKPVTTADNPIGQWNTFRIKMLGEKVTVHLNDKLVVDNVTLENYWDRKLPVFSSGQIELQCHGDPIRFRNIFIREIPRPDESVILFNGKDLTGWIGDTKGYAVENGSIVCKPGGNLYTENEYSDFVLDFDFKLTSGANNGLGIRTPRNVNAAYEGMELQILDNTAEKYKKLKPYQYHGSIYGVVPAKRGFLKPVGQWNNQKVIAKGDHIKVILNGEMIIDADISESAANGTMDGKKHPGLKRKSGHIAFLGHGSVVSFRNITINRILE